MKIGFFTDTYYPNINGVITSINILKTELEKKGHSVTIIAPKIKGEHQPKDVITLHSIPFLLLPEYKLGLYSYKTTKKIIDKQFDIIHTHTEFPVGVLGKIVGAAYNIPTVHTYHTLYEDYMHYIYKNISSEAAHFFVKNVSRAYLHTYSQIIVPSEKTHALLNRYKVKKPIATIPTGIEIEKFSVKPSKNQLNKLKIKLGIEKQDKVFLYVGRIAKEKSIDFIIDNINEVLTQYENAKYLIVGAGPCIDELKEQAKKYKLTNKIIFTGSVPREQIQNYYHLGDAFISASISETQGLTLIEAMSAGLLLISRKDDNLKGLLTNNVNGIVYETAEELKDALKNYLTKQIDVEQLTNNAIKTVREMSATSFGNKIEAIYHQLINKKNIGRINDNGIAG